MRLLTLPGSTLRVSALCLGTGGIGGDQTSNFAALDAFATSGGNFIDTAHVYGANGASEKTIGAWMSARRNRDRIVLATKGGHPSPDGPRLSPEQLSADLDESLRRLQTDYVDVYWLHRDDPTRSIEPMMQTLRDFVQSGRARYVGASNWTPARIREANALARQRNWPTFIADQTMWNAAVLQGFPYGDRTVGFMNAERRAFHESSGMAMVPFQPQAYGYFHRLQAGTLDAMNAGFRGFYDEPATRARYNAMRQVMNDTGLSLTQVVLGFLTSQPLPTVPILGFRSAEQLQDSLSVADVRLSPEQLALIENASQENTIS